MTEMTFTITEDGDIVALASPGADVILSEMGEMQTQRASHVEPAPRYDRWLFHTLRFLFGDKGRVSDWTRQWHTLWRVNTKPVGGPILRIRDVCTNMSFERYSQYGDQAAYWLDRQEAIAAEIEFLNIFFLEETL
jgi:hypothetical protein